MMRLIFLVLVGTVVLSPIPFGAIYPWSYSVMAVTVSTLVLLWALTLLAKGEHLAVPLSRLKWPCILFGVVIFWCLIQASPWTPESWHNQIWKKTAEATGSNVASYISVDPYATDTSAMRLLTYAGIFWLSFQFCRNVNRARQVFYAIAISGAVYATYGLLVEFSGIQKVLWYDKEAYLNSLTSSFRYKNAYASYAGMSILCTLALLIKSLQQENYAAMGPRQKLHFIMEAFFGRQLYLVVALIIITIALLLSGSRGGFFATFCAALCFGGIMHFSSGPRIAFGRGFAALGVLAGIGLFVLTGGVILDRFELMAGSELRPEIYRATIKAIADQPLRGWGLNTFEGVFAQYQSDVFWTRTSRAHNEYLDNALGMGVPAMVLFYCSLFLLVVMCIKGSIKRRRSNYYPAAAFAIAILATVHSVVDFTFQVPAVTATFALLMGAGCSQSWSTQES